MGALIGLSIHSKGSTGESKSQYNDEKRTFGFVFLCLRMIAMGWFFGKVRVKSLTMLNIRLCVMP